MTSAPSANKPGPRPRLLERADAANRPGMQLTPRDLEILQGVYHCRALTTHQIQQRYFPNAQGSRRGPVVRCQARLKLLFQHGYLQRDEQPTRLSEGRQPLVYFLAGRGADALAAHCNVPVRDLDWRPRDNVAGASQLFLTHLLKTNDVRMAMELAASQQQVEVAAWLDERSLRRRHAHEYVTLEGPVYGGESMALVPDGYVELVVSPYRSHHFLEIDMRTTIGLSQRAGQRDWARRTRAYQAYYESGQFHARYGAKNFRVLTVTTGMQRLRNLMEISGAHGEPARFWFTTFDDLNPTSVLTAPIWHVPGLPQPRKLLLE